MSRRTRTVTAVSAGMAVFVLGFAVAGYHLGIEGVYGFPAAAWVGGLTLLSFAIWALVLGVIVAVLRWVERGKLRDAARVVDLLAPAPDHQAEAPSHRWVTVSRSLAGVVTLNCSCGGYRTLRTVAGDLMELQACVAERSVVDDATDTITIPRPVVPHGPHGMTEDEATANYLAEVVRKIDTGFLNVGGSNVTATIRKILLHVRAALGGDQ